MESTNSHTTRIPYIWNIISSVAEAEERDVWEMQPPLADVLDTDALVNLLQHADMSTHITFRYRGWEIDVHEDGTVTVTEPRDGE